VCFYADKRQTDVAVTEIREVASQSDEDATAGVQLYYVTMVDLIFQFLSHTIDIKSSKLIDKLVTRDILSLDERKKIKGERRTDARVDGLLMMLSYKSAAEFQSFLTILGEGGQQSVTDVVHQVLDRVGRTGENPLQYTHGKTGLCKFQASSSSRKYDK